jgi:hypothetical protein
MKHFTLIVCFILLALLLIAAAPVSAALSISPNVGYTDGKSKTYTITGTNFTAGGNLTGGDVKLVNGNNDIMGTSCTWTDTEIVCKFRIPANTETGNWDLIVIKSDDLEVPGGDNKFTIMDSMALTSISPTSGRVNNKSVDFTLVGTGLSDVEDVYLHNTDYDNISASDFDVVSSVKVKGTFDLSDTEEDTYDVCVKDSYGTTECDLSFKIITDAVGSIYFETNPEGATVYVDNNNVGTSTFTYDDAAAGTYKVTIKKDGYNDYSGYVTAIENKRVVFYAKLTPVNEATTSATTAATATPAKTATPIKKPTVKVPTTWPSDTPTTAASPVDPALAIGAVGIGLGLAVFRRR